MIKTVSQNYRINTVFSCEFCEIFKNTFFCRTPPVATSVSLYVLLVKISEYFSVEHLWRNAVAYLAVFKALLNIYEGVLFAVIFNEFQPLESQFPIILKKSLKTRHSNMEMTKSSGVNILKKKISVTYLKLC